MRPNPFICQNPRCSFESLLQLRRPTIGKYTILPAMVFCKMIYTSLLQNECLVRLYAQKSLGLRVQTWGNSHHYSLRKQPTFGDATTDFPAKWRLRNERRNSILMTCHYPDLGSASDWSYRVGNLIQPIRSTTQIWVVTHHQYGISTLVSQTSFGGETSGSVAKCRLFSQANVINK